MCLHLNLHQLPGTRRRTQERNAAAPCNPDDAPALIYDSSLQTAFPCPPRSPPQGASRAWRAAHMPAAHRHGPRYQVLLPAPPSRCQTWLHRLLFVAGSAFPLRLLKLLLPASPGVLRAGPDEDPHWPSTRLYQLRFSRRGLGVNQRRYASHFSNQGAPEPQPCLLTPLRQPLQPP